MNKILILLKLCYKFSKKYMVEYITALTKPIIFTLAGCLCLFSVYISPLFVFLSFLSIPLLCYAFWKGYVITYALIPCAHSFLKETPRAFIEYCNETKQKEKDFIKFIAFVAMITILMYIPSFIYIAGKVPFGIDMLTDQQILLSNTRLIDNAFFINTLILAPFLNFILCGYYFKKEEENYLRVFFNCYKKLNIIGTIIAFVITLFSYKGGVIYMILALFLNPFIYSINTFWYTARLKN